MISQKALAPRPGVGEINLLFTRDLKSFLDNESCCDAPLASTRKNKDESGKNSGAFKALRTSVE